MAVSERIIVTPTLFQAANTFWVREIAAELLRLPKNIDEATAPHHAANMLHRVTHRGGFRGQFLVDDDEDEPAPEQEADPVEVKRSHAASRRRWVEAAK